MIDKVVDASAIAAVLFAEPESDAVSASLNQARLLAPNLIDYELANVCWKRCRRAPETAGETQQRFGQRKHLPINLVAVDSSQVAALAIATGLTAYDASYLWLARHLAAPLVTLDRRLAAAAMAA